MPVLNCGFETGVTGATITTADQGDGDAWDNVTIGANATLVYDTTQVALGAQSGKFTTTQASSATFVRWDAKLGTVTDHYTRFYLYATANPGAAYAIVSVMSVGNLCCALSVLNTSKLRIQDQGAVGIGDTTNAIALNQWVRIEAHFIHSATVGQVELKLFNTATSDTATETLTTTALQNTRVNADRIRFGIGSSTSAIGPIWIDQVQAGAVAYPGVAPAGLASKRMLVGVG